MAEALFWGALASSSLLVGGLLALRLRIPTGTMMPEAFDHGGRYVGLATTAGFGLAFAITALA